MRAKYSFIAVSTLLFSLNAYAGLFDSTPDFKCGRDDAISAAQSKIRDDAVSKLQVAYLANPSVSTVNRSRTTLQKLMKSQL